MPGISTRAAEVILAEVGMDMDRFTTVRHLASWAGVCPGNNKTGGKAKPGHTRPGNKWLKAALGIAAMSAVRGKDTYVGAQFRRIAARRGGKRAASATAQTLLTAIWHILQRGTPYEDLGADFFTQRVDPTANADAPSPSSNTSATPLHSTPHQPDQHLTLIFESSLLRPQA